MDRTPSACLIACLVVSDFNISASAVANNNRVHSGRTTGGDMVVMVMVIAFINFIFICDDEYYVRISLAPEEDEKFLTGIFVVSGPGLSYNSLYPYHSPRDPKVTLRIMRKIGRRRACQRLK